MTGLVRSTPSFSEFDPDVIPNQRKVIDLVKNEYDYNQGTLEIMLSGAVGSAKSIVLAHLAVFHCLAHVNACLLIGRRALPQLKETIFKKIKEHMEGVPGLVEGVDYKVSDNTCKIKFRNGSEIIAGSWADKNYLKFRSFELSSVIIEELTENDEEDMQAYLEIKNRVGRVVHIQEKFIICATNPDSPSHWAHKYFIDSPSYTRRVFYSVTTDNPFLPASYVRTLMHDMDPKLAQRMIYGKWIDINEEVVYYAYDKDKNFIKEDYKPNLHHPIYISWDFNIGEGKPLSAVLFQYINDVFHFFDQVVVHGMRTRESCDELAERGILDLKANFILTGDAAGKHRDTRNVKSDYDIIRDFFANYRTKEENPRSLSFEMRVPLSNGAIRTRHNLVNSYCNNALGLVRLFVYEKAKTADEGLRMTKLKPGGNYIEDDSKAFQHITTSIGYGMAVAKNTQTRQKQGTVQL